MYYSIETCLQYTATKIVINTPKFENLHFFFENLLIIMYVNVVLLSNICIIHLKLLISNCVSVDLVYVDESQE